MCGSHDLPGVPGGEEAAQQDEERPAVMHSEDEAVTRRRTDLVGPTLDGVDDGRQNVANVRGTRHFCSCRRHCD